MSGQKIIEVNKVSKLYETTSILDDISFSVEKGSLVVMIGPNGAGKTTLVKLLLGLEKPSSGEVKIFGKSPQEIREHIGYVPQKLVFAAKVPITVKEFLLLSRCEYSEHKTEQAAKKALENVDLNNIWDKQINKLSGGQFQRLMVARALIHKKDILILDEPAANIDVAGEQTIYDLLLKLQKEKKITTLIVSHELDMVFKYASHVLCINKRLVCHGVPKSVLTAKILEEMYGHHAGAYHHHCEK